MISISPSLHRVYHEWKFSVVSTLRGRAASAIPTPLPYWP